MNANPGDVLMKILAPPRYQQQIQRCMARVLHSAKAAPPRRPAGRDTQIKIRGAGSPWDWKVSR